MSISWSAERQNVTCPNSISRRRRIESWRDGCVEHKRWLCRTYTDKRLINIKKKIAKSEALSDTTWVSEYYTVHWNIVLSKRSQTQKAAYCMILFVWNINIQYMITQKLSASYSCWGMQKYLWKFLYFSCFLIPTLVGTKKLLTPFIWLGSQIWV